MKHQTRFKCLCCKAWQVADRRNAGRQKYCGRPACRKASKVASQRKWMAREENRDYFRGGDHVARVRAWRAANPGYWRRGKRGPPGGDPALQETLFCQAAVAERLAPPPPPSPQVALQDSCLSQSPLFVGLIAILSGLALQEDIAAVVGRLLSHGEDILRMTRGGLATQNHEKQDCSVSAATAPRASPV